MRCPATLTVPAEHGSWSLRCDQPSPHDGPHSNDLVDLQKWATRPEEAPSP